MDRHFGNLPTSDDHSTFGAGRTTWEAGYLSPPQVSPGSAANSYNEFLNYGFHRAGTLKVNYLRFDLGVRAWNWQPHNDGHPIWYVIK
jgi:hypothetical protein